MEHIDQPHIKSKIERVTIFSDSQSSIGILTLNWKIENHRNTTLQILGTLQKLQKDGITVNFQWTPGHANVNGNEIADKLAKEAAKEAEEQTGDAHITITKQDIKKAARDHVNTKWQNRWNMSERGRFYYNYHQEVNTKPIQDFPNKKMSSIVNNLRSGYAKLNDYLFKLNIADTPLCTCGSKETVEHYILHCNLYEDPRERMRQEKYLVSGSVHLDLEVLLKVGKDEQEDLTETERLRLLAHFIEETKRFDF